MEVLQLALKQRLIKKCNMFFGCQPLTIMALVQKLESSVAVPGQVVFRKSDKADRMYFLVYGKTVQYQTSRDGMAIELHGHVEEGETFGEMAFFEKKNRHSMSMKVLFVGTLCLSSKQNLIIVLCHRAVTQVY